VGEIRNFNEPTIEVSYWRIFIIVLNILSFIQAAEALQSERDSLWQLWVDESKPDTIRLAAIQRLAWKVIRSNPDSSETLAKQQLHLAEKSGNLLWQSKALNTLGVCHYLRDEYFPALRYYLRSLELKKEVKDLTGMASLHENISLVYSHLGRNADGLDHLQLAIQIHEQLDDHAALSSAINKLANLYFDQKNFIKALEYYFLSIELRSTNVDSSGLAMTLSNIGAAYQGLEKYGEALSYYSNSLSIRKSLGDEPGIAILYHNIADAYLGMNEIDSASSYITAAIETLTRTGNRSGLANAYLQMGQIEIGRNAYRQAANWCRQSLQISKEIDALPLERNACFCLYQSYSLMNDYNQALQYHERYVILSDSIQQGEIGLKLSQMELERAFIQDSLARQEEKLKMEVAYQKSIKNKNLRSSIFLALALIASLLGVGIMTRSFYLRRRIKRFQGKTDELKKLQLINEASILKTQVNPHFLFNSLSILTSLVHRDPNLAEQFIDQLSKSYRYILEQKDHELVPLRTEVNFIKSYVFLLNIRFENKFEVHFRFNELQLDDNLIAPMTLQLLIENAVKHNRMSERFPLNIYLELSDNYLVVKNNIQKRNIPGGSTGIGLKNIQSRYALLTDQKVVFTEDNNEFTVYVPLVSALT